MKLSEIRQMDARVENGAWVQSLAFEGVMWHLRGWMNADHERILAELWSALPAEKREDDAEAERVNTDALRRAVLLGWSGIDDPFNDETASEVIATRMIRRDIIACSRLVAARGKETLDDDVKN